MKSSWTRYIQKRTGAHVTAPALEVDTRVSLLAAQFVPGGPINPTDWQKDASGAGNPT
jgi:hypothetical protein